MMDARIASTYAADSEASLKSKSVRRVCQSVPVGIGSHWQTGIVAFVTNNASSRKVLSTECAKHLAQDFDTIYHLNFKGNARTSGERRKREGGNIFWTK